MNMEFYFTNNQMLNEHIKEQNKIMIAFINKLSVSIKKYYKITKGLLLEINFENNNNNNDNNEYNNGSNNQHKVNMIKCSLTNFLKEAKDLFVNLKLNYKYKRNSSSDYYNKSSNNNNLTPTKYNKVKINKHNTTPFPQQRTISLVNNTKKQCIHKSHSAKDTTIPSYYNNELINLTKDIIYNIKDIFLKKKSSLSNVNNSQINKLLSLLTQYVKALNVPHNNNNNNHHNKKESPLNSLYKSYFNKNKTKMPLYNYNKSLLNNISSSTSSNHYLNITECSSSPRIHNKKPYSQSNSIASYSSKEYKDKPITSLLCVKKQLLIQPTLNKDPHMCFISNNSTSNINTCSVKSISVQTENDLNEIKLKHKITELSDFIVKQQEIIDNNVNRSRNKIFYIDNTIVFSYNKSENKSINDIDLHNETKQINKNFNFNNEIINFNFILKKDSNTLSQYNEIKEQLCLIKTKNEKLHQQLQTITEEFKLKTSLYNELQTQLKFKDKSLSEANNEIASLLNQIKSLQGKLLHLETNNKNNNVSNTQLMSYEKMKNVFFAKLSKEKLIEHLNLLIQENDKFTKQYAKMRSEHDKSKEEYLELHLQYLQLKNNYDKESKEKIRIISDLKETIKHKSDMMISQATKLEMMEKKNKVNENIIVDLNNEVKKKEKVISELNSNYCKLVLEKEDSFMKRTKDNSFKLGKDV